MKQKNGNGKFSGFLDNGTSFDGDLQFEGTLRVDGNLSGKITTTDVLIVGPSATVRANVTAGSIEIHGRVTGDVSCTSRIEICAGGHLVGNVRTPRLVIEDGAVFEGQSQTTEAVPTAQDGANGQTVERSGAGELAALSASAGSAEPARQSVTRWKILGKQLESLRTSPTTTASDDEE